MFSSERGSRKRETGWQPYKAKKTLKNGLGGPNIMKTKLFVFVLICGLLLSACSIDVPAMGLKLNGTPVPALSVEIRVAGESTEVPAVDSPTAIATLMPTSGAPAQEKTQVVPPADPAKTATCLDADLFIAKLNKYHLTDRNDVRPVINWLKTLGNSTEVKAGDTVANAEDGFTIFYTEKDIAPERFSKTGNGTIVALFGGGRGTIIAIYDTGFIASVDGTAITGWCMRVNPDSDLTYWGGKK